MLRNLWLSIRRSQRYNNSFNQRHGSSEDALRWLPSKSFMPFARQNRNLNTYAQVLEFELLLPA
jgi:hypothetical protein